MLSLGIKWYSTYENRFESRVVEHLARHGHFEMLDALFQADSTTASIWPRIEYDDGNRNPLVGVIEYSIQQGNVVQ